MAVKLDTSLLSPRERIAAWRSALVKALGPIEVLPHAGGRLAGKLSSHARGALTFNSWRYSGQDLVRTPHNAAALQEEFYTLARPLQGPLRSKTRTAEYILQPGYLYLVNQSGPYRACPAQEYAAVSIGLPAATLRLRDAALKSYYAVPLAPGDVRSGLIRSFANHLAAGALQWSDRELCDLTERFLDLLALLILRPGRSCAEGDTSVRLAHRERARGYILAHLADPALTPARVAQACGISRSYLHAVFRDSGRGVEETIISERLDRCRRLLTDPRYRHLSIAQIARMSGFAHPSHFSRSFKERHGVSPRALRHPLQDRI